MTEGGGTGGCFTSWGTAEITLESLHHIDCCRRLGTGAGTGGTVEWETVEWGTVEWEWGTVEEDAKCLDHLAEKPESQRGREAGGPE